MPWLPRRWLNGMLCAFEQMNERMDEMTAVTDALKAAIDRATDLDKQLLTEVHDLTVQNQKLTEQIKNATNDAQVQQLADQINANSDAVAKALAASFQPSGQ